MNRSKQIGTRGETAVATYARGNGFPGAERRALSGSSDRGDILLCPGVILEVKAGAMAQGASDKQVEAWWQETVREIENADAELGMLVMARKGVGVSNVHRWWAVLPLVLVVDRGWPIRGGLVRMHLSDGLLLLRHWGYGDEP